MALLIKFMGEEDKKGSDKPLRLVVKTGLENHPVSIQEFFDTMVVPFFQKMIPIVSGKKDDVDYDTLEVSDRLEPELRAMLEGMSLNKPSKAELLKNEDWLEKKMAVRLVQDESCYMLVAWAADDVAIDGFAPGKEYYFDPAVFAKDVNSVNPYEGLKSWQILQTVQEGKGKNSQISKDVERVSELTRTLLYNVVIPEKERESLAAELYILRMKTGAAAIAVIKSFLKGYQEGKWVNVVNPKGRGVLAAADGSSYLEAMNRLMVGRYNLAKLVGMSLTIFE